MSSQSAILESLNRLSPDALYRLSAEQYLRNMTRKDWQKKRKKMSGREGPKKGKVR